MMQTLSALEVERWALSVGRFLFVISPVILAAFAFYEIRLQRANHRLRRKLRQALEDCRAFYEIEQRLCGTVGGLTGRTIRAVQLNYRMEIRNDGMPSPSDNATPKRIAEELNKL